MRKIIYTSTLSVLVFSCATPKKGVVRNVSSKKTTVIPPKKKEKNPSHAQHAHLTTQEKKPQITHFGNLDFFKENISNPAKNDNTISYGSIVSAKPMGYMVTKNHFPSLGQGFRQRYIILHYTALNNEASLRVLTQQAVSAHYLVNDTEDNEIYQLVDENKRAYHAGVSYWRGNNNLNDSSIGIEIVNQAKDVPGGYYFPDFPDYQVKKVAELVKDIANRYGILPQNILAHSDIAPTRKQDPGPKFPWKKLYTDYGIGMWYDEDAKERFMVQLVNEDLYAPSVIYQYQKDLNQFGFNIATLGMVDEATKKTITAFQYRFRPENYDGIMDVETYAILKALLQKYP